MMVALIEGVLIFAGIDVAHGVLIDPDCYMHLQRAFRLMTGGWRLLGFDPRLNAPFGYAIHWTSLFDGLLVAGAWPLTLFGLSAHQALYVWGSAISPVLLMLAMAVFAIGVWPWVRGPSFLWLTFLLFTQPDLSRDFYPGRPDHHSLILGLFLVQLAWIYSLVAGRTGNGIRTFAIAFAAGAAAGIELCTTVEALLIILLISLSLGLAWCLFAEDVLRELAAYWLGCLVVTLAWLALTRSSVFFEPTYDRVSVVHACVLCAGIAALILAGFLARRMPRFAAMGCGSIAAASMVAAFYPAFFLGPWPHLDPVVSAWHREIGELQPLMPDSWLRLESCLGQLTAALLSLPFIFYHLLRGERRLRLAMLTSLCGFCLFGLLSLAQMRWSGELQAVILLPWTLTTQRIMQSNFALPLGNHNIPLRGGILSVALLLQMVPLLQMAPLGNQLVGHAGSSTRGCDWTAATRALAEIRPQHGTIMTDLLVGPEILWRTDFDVVGAPYEIPPAIVDTKRFEKGSLREARQVLVRRHPTYVLSCGSLPKAQAMGLEHLSFAVPNFGFYRVGS